MPCIGGSCGARGASQLSSIKKGGCKGGKCKPKKSNNSSKTSGIDKGQILQILIQALTKGGETQGSNSGYQQSGSFA